jgi:creatinine amidohydrolase
MIHAIDRAQVRQDLYDASLALPRQTAGTWSAYPFPASIILYQPKQGYVKFDQGKADAYFKGVVDKLVDLTNSTVKLWDKAGIFK